MTFVIDSQFVIANVPLDSATGRFADPRAFGDLRCADLASLSVLPEPDATRWSACSGVPVMLILTKSKQWRPPAKTSP
jgi:hypothetical protein